MLRKRGILIQIVTIIAATLIVFGAAQQVRHSLRYRDTLIRLYREQSLALSAGLFNSLFDADTTALEQDLQRLFIQTPNLEFIAVVGPDNMVIAHTNMAYAARSSAELKLDDLPLNKTLRRTLPDFGTVYLTTSQVPVSPVASYNLVVGMAARPVDEALRRDIFESVLIIGAALIIAGAVAFLVLWLNILRPLQAVRHGVQQLGLGQLGYRFRPQGIPELYRLAHALNEIVEAWNQTQTDFNRRYQDTEQRMRDRDRDLEIASEIARMATRLYDREVLLTETVEQIRRRFDVIYHAQIFLLDVLGEQAVLVASTGTAGRQLLQLGHKLAVGSESVIGRVTGRNQPVIASDTLASEVPWRPNPLLPDTRAEMALPLAVENRVIGALDVQSTQPDVFTADMIQVFEVLAGQIAIAIENTRLLAEAEQHIREIDDLNRQLTRTAWQSFSRREKMLAEQGYVFDQMQVVPLESGSMERLMPDRLEMPIQVRGETIGLLVAALGEDRQISEDDRILVQAVAERVALAVENARLFQQTQYALAETERLYETARAVSSSSDMTAIYQLVSEQLSVVPYVDTIEVMLSGPDPTLVQYLETTYVWRRYGMGAGGLADHERLPVSPAFDVIEQLPTHVPAAYTDIRRDMSPDNPLYARLLSRKASSAVIAPLNAGGRWFGVIVCSSTSPGGFETDFVTFTSALADQLAIAIENRRLFDEAQTEARRARALAEAGQLASQISGDYEAGLQNLFQAVAGPGDYNRWWFGMFSPDGTLLEQVIASDGSLPQVVDVQRDQHALAEAARIGEIVLVNDPTDHPAVGTRDTATLSVWGKHIAMPVKIGTSMVGVLLVGRSLEGGNLDERDIQLAATLVSQVAVATENQRLFAQAEAQRQNLQTIVDTMPTGVLVVDRAGQIILSNQALRDLMGPQMEPGHAEPPRPYFLSRTTTREPYPEAEWPLTHVLLSGRPATVDDITVHHPDGTMLNLLARAAPIMDSNGNVTAVVGAFQDITELYELEQALQDSLRETTLLYEASRAISRATGLDELLQVTLREVNILNPDQTFIFWREETGDNQVKAVLLASQPTDLMATCDAALCKPLLDTEPHWIEAASAPDTLIPVFQATGLAAVGSFPLGVRGQVNGWLVIGFAQPHNFTSDERRFVTTLSDQAAITIENQQLLARTEMTLQETAILYQAGRAIASAQNPADVLQAFVDYAAPPTITQARLYLLVDDPSGPERKLVDTVASWTADQASESIYRRYPIEDFPLLNKPTQSGPVYIDEVTLAEGTSPAEGQLLAELGLRSATLIPVCTPNRPLGLVLLGATQPQKPTASEIRMFESLADQAAVALESNRLFEQAQHRARQLATVAEISRAVTSILQLDQLLPQVVELIRDLLGYDHVQVFLLNSEGTQANLVASTGKAGRELLAIGHSLPVGSQSVIGQVTSTGLPQIALDTAQPGTVHRFNPYLPDTRSEMALPLIARGQIVGALDLQSNLPDAFSQEDIRTLTSLADLVAAAIDNARLFTLSEQRAEDMAFLFNVMSAATTSPDLEESLQLVVETLRGSLPMSAASVYLPDESGQYMVRGTNADGIGLEADSTSGSIERSLIGWVDRHREAVIIGNLSEDPRRLPTNSPARSVMATPLVTGGSLVGILVVESEQVQAFDQDDLRLLQTLSGSLAAIIQSSRLLREVQAANEKLREVDRLKTNFLAAMSHELRTPLNSIIGFSRVILKGIDGPLTEMQEQDLTTIYESGRHLLGLVNDILDQAKIEAGKMELSFAHFKLPEVIHGVMSTAIGLTRDKPIALHTQIADTLPLAYGDEFRTRQILLNLVSNASKFTNAGHITVSAFSIFENDREFIQVSVTDTGIGIAEEDMGLLFEPFQQLDNTTTRAAEGTGMGLPLAKSLTELQGGRIWVTSQLGVGSTFSFTIPTGPVLQESPDDMGQFADTVQAVDDQTGGQTQPAQVVFVIENSEEMIDLYQRYLGREGYQVIGTTHLAEIEQLVVAYAPAVILLDVSRHEGDGWELLAQLTHHEATRNVPVIVCSMNADTARSHEAGAVAHLVKPFSEDQLIAAVHQATSQPGRPCILIVDDKPESVRLFRDALEATGSYAILEATTGQQALDLIHASRRIDLVILDLRMPEVDGFTVLRVLRDSPHTARTPVLVLTAEEVQDDERASLNSIEVYRKDTLDEDNLLRRVAAQLGNHKRENGNQ